MTMNLFNTAEIGGFGGLEDMLSNLIEPVNPDPKFVEALKPKLSQAPTVIMESGHKNLPLLAAAAGLAAGALVIYWLTRKKETSE
jgi:hypothetical protein